jgi:glycosyltransferase involved in cell wall biosynthesis
VLRDVSLLDDQPEPVEVEDYRRELGIVGPLSMYVGNLQPYQGIDLLLGSFAIVHRERGDAHLVVIGGMEDDVEHYRRRAHSLGLSDAVHFVGPRPVQNLSGYMNQADVLVSPRVQGVNTPMKVYSYLDSGVACLLTDLPTHTQVADSTIAQLAPPDPASFAVAWLELIEDQARRRALATRARERIRRMHSREAFNRTVAEVYDHLEGLVAARSEVAPQT